MSEIAEIQTEQQIVRMKKLETVDPYAYRYAFAFIQGVGSVNVVVGSVVERAIVYAEELVND